MSAVGGFRLLKIFAIAAMLIVGSLIAIAFPAVLLVACVIGIDLLWEWCRDSAELRRIREIERQGLQDMAEIEIPHKERLEGLRRGREELLRKAQAIRELPREEAINLAAEWANSIISSKGR